MSLKWLQIQANDQHFKLGHPMDNQTCFFLFRTLRVGHPPGGTTMKIYNQLIVSPAPYPQRHTLHVTFHMFPTGLASSPLSWWSYPMIPGYTQSQHPQNDRSFDYTSRRWHNAPAILPSLHISHRPRKCVQIPRRTCWRHWIQRPLSLMGSLAVGTRHLHRWYPTNHRIWFPTCRRDKSQLCLHWGRCHHLDVQVCKILGIVKDAIWKSRLKGIIVPIWNHSPPSIDILSVYFSVECINDSLYNAIPHYFVNAWLDYFQGDYYFYFTLHRRCLRNCFHLFR